MAINSGQIDLNSETVLVDHENEVVGVKSTVSKVVSDCVSHFETLSGDPVSGSEAVVHDQKVCHFGDGGGVNGSVELVSSMNHECDVMISDSGIEGLGEEPGLVGLEVVDGVCNGKEGMVENEDEKRGFECSGGVLLSCGDRESDEGLVFEFNHGIRSEDLRDVSGNCLPSIEVVSNNVAQGGDNGVSENCLPGIEVVSNNVAQQGDYDVSENCLPGSDVVSNNVMDQGGDNDVSENCLPGIEVVSNNVAQGGDNDVSENCLPGIEVVLINVAQQGDYDVSENCLPGIDVVSNNVVDQGGDNDVNENCLPGIEVVSNNVAQGGDNDVVECEKEVKNGEGNVADSLIVKKGLEDSRAGDVATYQLQDGVPCMEVVDVNAEESLHMKDLSTNCLELERSCELKQPASLVDVTQNQTMVIDIVQGQLFENIQKESDDFNLVVDFNPYRNKQEVGVYRESMSPELNSFSVSDLVWGKVTGHPWWPGQIFDASSASEKAKRHLKEHCYLVAYFGDGSFAWNDLSMIKPFQMHFSQLVKQCNSENFHHAVDCALEELSRRVEFGLSCPCLPEDMFSTVKTQVISNAGIDNRLSRRTGGDRFINASSFEPMKLINFVKSLAQLPLVESDQLDFVTARAQLSAFYRSKGYSQLHEFPVLGGLIDDDMETLFMREKEQYGYQTHIGYSQQECKQRGKKHKLLSDLMSEKDSWISRGEHSSEQKAKSIPRRRGRKRKRAYITSEDSFHNSQIRKLTQLQHASINEMRSQLSLAAEDPFGESCSSDMVHFFSEFRNSTTRDHSAYLDQGISLEQMDDGSMTSAMEPCNDSYWTDRIIQSIPEEQSLTQYQNDGAIFLPETLTEANPLSFKLPPGAGISTDLGFNQQDTGRNLGSESSKLVEHLDESSKEDLCPTALTLKFSSLESVPSTTDLNEIFSRFGPLIESKTELLEKTNRARVVFQRRSDAEAAFSSAGKYSIFGPSLVSYRLKILPRKPQKSTGKRGRKRKETSSEPTAAFDALVLTPPTQ